MKLDDLMAHLYRIYGRRNSIYLPSISERIAFLSLGIRNLEDAVENKKDCTYQLASVFGRICCVAENFPNMLISEALAQKYPLKGCSYCGKFPCGCDTAVRKESKLIPIADEQKTWSLNQFQVHLNDMYGEANKKRGVESALLRLFSESAELTALQLVMTSQTSQAEMYLEYSLEIADTLARTLAVANITDIDLETAVLELYGNGCHGCREMVCTICGPLSVKVHKTYGAHSHT